MFVALSRFVVRDAAMAEATRTAFRERPHLVESAPGFERLDVISPEERPEEFWLITYWTDEASYRAWHSSPAHTASHAFMPRGLKLVPSGTDLSFFTHVAS